uniref:Uncharacterized protein n=1 Tax=Pristionchus pacificus TaxID=54126 RepID=A0A2A6CB43_PRIPA|eukprot:PDM75263.1 hypothetical protein PRIPAC_43457 [Pristionchus pacificus]
MLGLVFRWSALLVKELLVGLGDMGLGTSSFLRASYAAAAPTATRAAGASTTPPAIFPAVFAKPASLLATDSSSPES